MGKKKWIKKTGGFPPQPWLVVFLPQENTHIINKIFTGYADYQHAFGILYQPDLECHVLLDWRGGILDVAALYNHEVDGLLDWVQLQKGTVVQYMANREYGQTLIRLGFAYCTIALQHALGLPKHLISTPDKLYKQLIAGGAKTIMYKGERK